jgi:hypothetical protein
MRRDDHGVLRVPLCQRNRGLCNRRRCLPALKTRRGMEPYRPSIPLTDSLRRPLLGSSARPFAWCGACRTRSPIHLEPVADRACTASHLHLGYLPHMPSSIGSLLRLLVKPTIFFYYNFTPPPVQLQAIKRSPKHPASPAMTCPLRGVVLPSTGLQICQ